MVQTQEMWSAVLPMVAIGDMMREGKKLNPVQILLLGMFLAHYFWRSFGYSLLLRGGKPTPVHIWLLACTFCILNGFLQVCCPELLLFLQSQNVLCHTGMVVRHNAWLLPVAG